MLKQIDNNCGFYEILNLKPYKLLFLSVINFDYSE